MNLIVIFWGFKSLLPMKNSDENINWASIFLGLVDSLDPHKMIFFFVNA